jgi:hypothetical protein
MRSTPDLDLHPWFRDPEKARAILDLCISDNRSKGIYQIRVIHGKGRGDFRKLIQSHLSKNPFVEGYMLCDLLHGGSGATWVYIAPSPDDAKVVTKTRSENPLTPVRPLYRWILYLIFIVTCFLVFPQWIVRVIMILFILYLEFRVSGDMQDGSD